jgi:MFS transporter, OPA family, glycerol-3-phosphate transporter
MADELVAHSRAYRIRRFLNWFPLGLTYAFLYMARYNLTVSKNAFADLMSKESFGIIFGVGTVTYAFSFLINGPLTDRIGGKKAMLIGAAGAAIMNIVMGFLTYGILVNHWQVNMTLAFSIVYAMNMYFQSYGAVAIVKVNSSWFHVRERGVFGGIFGILISLGVYFAFDWGQAVINATKAVVDVDLNFIQQFLRAITIGNSTSTIDQTWWVFFVPAVLLGIFFIIELFWLRDHPSQAGFDDINTGDATAGEDKTPYKVGVVIKKIITNPIIMTVAIIEFCTGLLRNGIMHWYPIYSKEFLKLPSDHFMRENWGLMLMLAGAFGGMIAGYISDKLFQSRRGPSAGLLYGSMVVATIIMNFVLGGNPFVLGFLLVFMSFCVIGTHGMLSGVATMDFGGTKGAATAVGLIDGFVYLGTAVESFSLGYLTTKNWHYWPPFLVPFAIIGFLLCLRIWKAMPDSKRRAH